MELPEILLLQDNSANQKLREVCMLSSNAPLHFVHPRGSAPFSTQRTSGICNPSPLKQRRIWLTCAHNACVFLLLLHTRFVLGIF